METNTKEAKDFLKRIEALEQEEVINILKQLDYFDVIAETCNNRQEFNECLLQNILSDNIDEIELIICESGK